MTQRYFMPDFMLNLKQPLTHAAIAASVTLALAHPDLAQAQTNNPPKAKPTCYTEHYTKLVSAFYTVGEPPQPGANPEALLFASGEVEFLRSAPAQLVGEEGVLTQYQVGQNTVRRFDFKDPQRNGSISLNFGPWFPVVGYEVDRSGPQQIQTFYFDTNNALKMAAEVLVREPRTREVCLDSATP